MKQESRETGTQAELRLVLLVVLLAATVFGLDLVLPRGMATSVGYVAVVLVSCWLPQRRSPLVLAIVCSGLTLLGVVYAPPGSQLRLALTNAVLAVGVIWGTALLALQSKRERERAEETLCSRLHESEGRYQRIFATSPDYIYVTDPAGHMLEANPALLHRVGFSREQMQQKSFLDFFAGDNLEEVSQAFTTLVMHGQEVRGLEVRAKTAQGEIFTYEVNAIPVQEQGQVTTILSVARDVTDRKRAEEVLREHAQIIDHIHDAVVATDLAGSITTWNKGAARLYGYTAEEMRGHSIARLYPVENHDFLQHQVIAPLQEQGHHEVEVRARTKAGAHVWVQLSLALLRNQAGVPYGMIGYAMDISARKQTEGALRRSEQELADFFENATVGLHWVGPDGTILRVNQAELDLLGYTREEYIGHHIADFHADPSVIADMLQRLTSGQTLHDYEARLRGKDGALKTVLIDSNVLWDGDRFLHTRCFTRDITERKRAEAALRESEARYRSLFENANDAIVTFTLEGIVTSVNQGLEAMLGWTRAEVVGQHYRTFVAPASVALGEERIRRFLTGERMSSIFEAEMVGKDGKVVPVEARTRVIRAADGTPLSFQGIYRDMAARKAMEQQRADFLAMLTHDIRNPLSVILGYTEMLVETDGIHRVAGAADLLGRIRSSSLTVHSLVTNYLNLLRIDAGQFTLAKHSLPLNELLLRVGRQYEAEARRRHLRLDYHLQPDLPMIEADAVALERVFANLLHNALKFTPHGGQVRIHSARRERAVMAAVADTGPGLAAEEIPVLFEKYQKAASAKPQQGTGLGLFIAQAVVQAHGGRITVDSTLGVGTCFSVVLPVGPAAEGEYLF